ncbi:MAG: tRNA pseudouridine synthase C [Sodalis sp.]|nr:MAG: tRNA pseudouridine synthase C [Sodalis sp.]
MFTMHRLDLPTSGVLLLALSGDVTCRLAQGFIDYALHQNWIKSPIPRKRHSRCRAVITHWRGWGMQVDVGRFPVTATA